MMKPICLSISTAQGPRTWLSIDNYRMGQYRKVQSAVIGLNAVHIYNHGRDNIDKVDRTPSQPTDKFNQDLMRIRQVSVIKSDPGRPHSGQIKVSQTIVPTDLTLKLRCRSSAIKSQKGYLPILLKHFGFSEEINYRSFKVKYAVARLKQYQVNFNHQISFFIALLLLQIESRTPLGV